MTNGIWERIGQRTLNMRQMNQQFDANGDLRFLVRTDLVGTVAPDLQGGTFTGTIRLFLPGDNPLDPAAQAVAEIPVTGTSQRMDLP